jgi:RNA polymerase sigma factor (sigma-70 family)
MMLAFETVPCDAPANVFAAAGPENEAPDDAGAGATPGERAPLTPAQQALATKYIALAKKLARPLKAWWPNDAEEYQSAALVALVEAAQSFDPARNVKFATFARFRIWGALRDTQRRLIASGFRFHPEDAPNIYSLPDNPEENGRVYSAEQDPPVGSDLEELDAIEFWLRKLPPKHAAACRELFINDCNQSEAAERLGCSKSRINYLRKQSFTILNHVIPYEERRGQKALAKG